MFSRLYPHVSNREHKGTQPCRVEKPRHVGIWEMFTRGRRPGRNVRDRAVSTGLGGGGAENQGGVGDKSGLPLQKGGQNLLDLLKWGGGGHKKYFF